MAYSSLQEFVRKLEKEGELFRIKAKVSPELEITEITDRISKSYGPALLFEQVYGSEMPLLINAFGSDKRMAMALGVDDINDVAREIENLIRIDLPESIIDKFKILGTLAKLAKFPPKMVKNAKCQEVVHKGKDASLNELPIIKCWPEDGGRYITLPQVFTKHPLTRQRNVGMYRLQVFDEHTTGAHWQIHHDGAANFREYKKTTRGCLSPPL